MDGDMESFPTVDRDKSKYWMNHNCLIHTQLSQSTERKLDLQMFDLFFPPQSL